MCSLERGWKKASYDCWCETVLYPLRKKLNMRDFIVKHLLHPLNLARNKCSRAEVFVVLFLHVLVLVIRRLQLTN